MSGHSVSRRPLRPISISRPSPLPIPLPEQSSVLKKPFILPKELVPKSTQPLWARADYREGTSFFSSAVVHCFLVLVMALFASSPPLTQEILLVVRPTETVEEMLSQVEFVQEELELPEMEEQPLTPTLVTSSAIESTPLEVDPTLDPTTDVLLDGPAGLEEMLPVGDVLSQIGRGGGRIGAGGGGPAAGDLNMFARRLAREVAKTGDVQISLAWPNVNDVDLHVVTPSGEFINFRTRRSRCGGELDVDANVQPETTEPVISSGPPEVRREGSTGLPSIFIAVTCRPSSQRHLSS